MLAFEKSEQKIYALYFGMTTTLFAFSEFEFSIFFPCLGFFHLIMTPIFAKLYKGNDKNTMAKRYIALTSLMMAGACLMVLWEYSNYIRENIVLILFSMAFLFTINAVCAFFSFVYRSSAPNP